MTTKNPPTLRTIPLLLAVFLMGLPTRAQYGGGTGEPNDPWLIYTPAQMNAIGADPNHWDKHFKLMADIDLSVFDGQEGRPAFSIIGYDLSWNNRKPFTGTFDGNGHTISNFRHTSVNASPLSPPIPQNNVGLFSCIEGLHAEIRNLGLVGPIVHVAAGSRVGSLVGRAEGAAITGCYVEDANVTGTSEVGGLVGRSGAVVSNSFSTGLVSGQTGFGGVFGSKAGFFIDCYSNARVSGSDSVGGLVGRPAGGRGSNLGLILNCYSTGRVTGATAIGGLVGAEGANVIGSYWDVEPRGQAESAGGIGKSTLEMQTAGTFLGWGACDHNGVWTIDEGRDYPRLSWQGCLGQALAPLQLADLLVGSGTADDPFLIYTAEELNAIGLFPCEWNSCFRLMADVDMSAYGEMAFNIIGVYEIPFTAVFDGNGRSISNLILAAGRGTGTGPFGYVADPNAEIKNLALIHSSARAGRYGSAGALVAFLYRGSVTNCHGTDNTVSGETDVGGLVGTSAYGTISDCSSTGTVVGTFDTGGLVGENRGLLTRCSAGAVVSGRSHVGGLAGWNNGTVTGCCSVSTVTGESVGGLVGRNGPGTGDGIITNSYASGTVSGSFRAGGLVAENAAGAIANCYSTTTVTGGWKNGGLVAYDWHDGLRITASFWNMETSGQTGSAAGIGLGTAEMQTAQTFLDAGWDFVGETANGTEDIWWILEGKDYPKLWWERGDEASP